MLEKEIARRKRLSVPRVKPTVFKDLDENRKNNFLSDMVQFFSLSDPSEFFEMDISKLDEQKLLFLYSLNLNVSKTGNRYLDLFPYISPHFQREPFKSSIPAREREICIIRTGWLCQADYEVIHHIYRGLVAGITAEEVIRILEGPEAPGWNLHDALILRATDELHENYFLCDDTWIKLTEKYNEKQVLELILTIGHYTKVAMFLNSTGVQVEIKYQTYGGLSDKVNNDERIKLLFEVKNRILEIYDSQILKEDFQSAMNSLNELIQKEAFKKVRKWFSELY
jgi:hypothetical protein